MYRYDYQYPESVFLFTINLTITSSIIEYSYTETPIVYQQYISYDISSDLWLVYSPHTVQKEQTPIISNCMHYDIILFMFQNKHESFVVAVDSLLTMYLLYIK